jgi:hypothetical protein
MSIRINGRKISATGTNISIVGDRIYVDGQLVDETGAPKDEKVFNIVVEGDAGNIDGDFARIDIQGSAARVKTMSGDVTVRGEVRGDVGTMSGDVRVGGSVAGKIKTMSGDVHTG